MSMFPLPFRKRFGNLLKIMEPNNWWVEFITKAWFTCVWSHTPVFFCTLHNTYACGFRERSREEVLHNWDITVNLESFTQSRWESVKWAKGTAQTFIGIKVHSVLKSSRKPGANKVYLLDFSGYLIQICTHRILRSQNHEPPSQISQEATYRNGGNLGPWILARREV